MIQVGESYLFVCKHFDDDLSIEGQLSVDDLIVIAKNNNLKCTVIKYAKDGTFGRTYEIIGCCGGHLTAYEDELLPLQQ